MLNNIALLDMLINDSIGKARLRPSCMYKDTGTPLVGEILNVQQEAHNARIILKNKTSLHKFCPLFHFSSITALPCVQARVPISHD